MDALWQEVEVNFKRTKPFLRCHDVTYGAIVLGTRLFISKGRVSTLNLNIFQHARKGTAIKNDGKKVWIVDDVHFFIWLFTLDQIQEFTRWSSYNCNLSWGRQIYRR